MVTMTDPNDDMQLGAGGAASPLGSARSPIGPSFKDGELCYDEHVAQDATHEIAHGWFEYRRIHGALNSALREKLGH